MKNRKKIRRGNKRPKGIWTITKADTEFSKWIRARDKKCVRCGRTNLLQCSHFWSRSHKATRYDPDNCDTLCYPCHYGNSKGWEFEKNGAYQDFKFNQLGKERFNALAQKGRSSYPQNTAIRDCMKLLGKLA